MSSIRLRRCVFFSLSLTSSLLFLWLVDLTLPNSTPLLLEVLILVLFGLTLPWMMIGFWNAIIGLWLCQFSKNPLTKVMPLSMQIAGDEPITTSTAILLCIRNETPDRLQRNLQAMLAEICADHLGGHFHIYILSDTNDLNIQTQEQACFDLLKQQWGQQCAITYRLRTQNTGYKAGNIADFCQQWGHQHDFALTLDADSLMASSAMARLVRMMQASPQVGILQGLVIGLPSMSAFARLFQYGMRLGMRSYTMGSAWWQADCGPYWGHNALLRLQPFIKYCSLPTLPSRSGAPNMILSHDLVEALLMRRADFEVRIYPQEDHSWEENPQTLTEYIRRDLRWCEGNLQYFHLLTLPKLKLLSRFQLLLAIFMFVGAPAWIILMILITVSINLHSPAVDFENQTQYATLFILTLVMWYLPKICGALNVLLRQEERARFGGTGRFSISLMLETIFSLLMTPIVWLNQSIYIVLMLFGKKQGWAAQSRDDHSISLKEALKQFWPHTILGLFLSSLLYQADSNLLPYGMLFFSGLVFAIPFAIMTSQPMLGKFLIRQQLLSLPEEISPPKTLLSLDLPALKTHA